MTGTTLDGSALAPVTATTRVRLRPLRSRRDGQEWVIGRVETGELVRAPEVVHRAMALLDAGQSVGEVQAQLGGEAGEVLDVAELVGALRELEFVAAVDGCPVDQTPPPRPSLPWLRARHVRWLLHPATAVGALVLIAAGGAAVALDPSLAPRPDDLVWSGSGSAVLTGNAAIEWTLIYLHEVGHLATARAAGVPGRIKLGTRLLFLVAETDVTGIWVEPRRTRLTVYLAGMTVNLVCASVGVLLLAATSPTGLVRDVVAAAVLLSVLTLPVQLMIYMRTDVYFVVQDLTGCTNLYADATTCLRELARRLIRRLRPDTPEDNATTTSALPIRERRVVKLYSVILLVGTVTAILVMTAVIGPALVALVGPALRAVIDHSSLPATIDGATALLVVGGAQLLWMRAWWRRHGCRVICFLSPTKERR